jgi:hypothetical protein
MSSKRIVRLGLVRTAPVSLFRSGSITIVLAVVLWTAAGCGSSRHLVGKWQMSGAPVIWEFFSNGAVQIGDSKGKYRLDRDHLKIEQGFATSVYQMEFVGDHMILRGSGNSKLEFTKVK